jgi:hypothetical protein
MARVINVVDRTTATPYGLRHTFAACETSLVPELKRQPYHRVAALAEHGGDGGGIHPTGHGNGDDGLSLVQLTPNLLVKASPVSWLC